MKTRRLSMKSLSRSEYGSKAQSRSRPAPGISCNLCATQRAPLQYPFNDKSLSSRSRRPCTSSKVSATPTVSRSRVMIWSFYSAFSHFHAAANGKGLPFWKILGLGGGNTNANYPHRTRKGGNAADTGSPASSRERPLIWSSGATVARGRILPRGMDSRPGRNRSDGLPNGNDTFLFDAPNTDRSLTCHFPPRIEIDRIFLFSRSGPKMRNQGDGFCSL